MADKIQLRRDTAANWTTANPILAQGETGIEIDNLGTSLPVKEKIGDGVTAWDSLPYNITGGNGDVQSVTGPNVDNTDPANPIVNEPTLKTVGGESLSGSGNIDVVKSVSGDGVGGTASDPVLIFPNADEVDDSSTSNKFTTQAEKDQIAQNTNFITLLQTNKADQTALDAVAADVSTNASDIDAIESDLSNKASQSDLNALDSRVTQNEADITGKISISTVASATEKGGVFLSYDAAENKLTISDNPI